MDANRIPTIRAIQQMNLILVVMTAAILAVTLSTRAAVACLLGGAVVIANLWILNLLGGLLLSAAGAGISGTAAKLGVLAIPLKMLLVIGLVYLIFTRTKIDGLGFGLGVLTQMTAAIIETGRASMRASS